MTVEIPWAWCLAGAGIALCAATGAALGLVVTGIRIVVEGRRAPSRSLASSRP